MRLSFALLAVIVVAAMPAMAAAQPPARTFDELSTHLGRADEVWITDPTGKETKSRIVTITASMLTVSTKHGRLDLQAGDIVRVRQERPDAIRNGILIGALAGGAYPLWYFSKGYETGESLRENVDSVLFAAHRGMHRRVDRFAHQREKGRVRAASRTGDLPDRTSNLTSRPRSARLIQNQRLAPRPPGPPHS